MKSANALRGAVALVTTVLCTSLSAGPLEVKKGSGGSEIQGSAGPSGSQNDNGLEHCEKPMGALAVVEPQEPRCP